MNEERRDMNDGKPRKKAKLENATTNSLSGQESKKTPMSQQNKSIKTILTSYLNNPALFDSTNQRNIRCPKPKFHTAKRTAFRQKKMTPTEFLAALTPTLSSPIPETPLASPISTIQLDENPVSPKFFAIKSKMQKHSTFEVDNEIRQSLHDLSIVVPKVDYHLIHELPDCKSHGCEEAYSDFVVYLRVKPNQNEDSTLWTKPKLTKAFTAKKSHHHHRSKSKLLFEPLPYLPADHAIFCRLNTFRQEESLFLDTGHNVIQDDHFSVVSNRIEDQMQFDEWGRSDYGFRLDLSDEEESFLNRTPQCERKKETKKKENEESDAVSSDSQNKYEEADEENTVQYEHTYCGKDPLYPLTKLSKRNFCRHIKDPEHFEYAHSLRPITYRRKFSQLEYIRQKFGWLQQPTLNQKLNPPTPSMNPLTPIQTSEKEDQIIEPFSLNSKKLTKLSLLLRPKSDNFIDLTMDIDPPEGIENYQPFSFDVTFTSFVERKVPNFIEYNSLFLRKEKKLRFPLHSLLQPTYKYSGFVSMRKNVQKNENLGKQDSEYVLRWLFEPPFCDSSWIIINRILERYFISTPIMLSNLRSNCDVIGSGASAIVFKAIAKIVDIPNMKENEKFINSIKQQKFMNFSEETSFADPKITSSHSSETRNVYLAIKDFKNNCPHKYFLNELEVFALLTPHSCIVDFYGFVYDPLANTRILFMEFCELGSLFDILHGNGDRLQTRNTNELVPTMIKHGKKLEQNRSKIALQIARAVQHLHSFGFVHIDLTSRNVLLTDTFDAKLTDFGLASKLYEGIGTRQPNHGPSYWKAPEIAKRNMKVAAGIVNQQHNDIFSTKQKNSTKPVREKQEKTHKISVPKKSTIEVYYTSAVDIFSYAIILWELFHLGMFPWNGQLDLCERLHLGMRPEIHHNVPLFWEEIIVRCWAQDPEKRPKAHEIVDKILEQEFCSE